MNRWLLVAAAGHGAWLAGNVVEARRVIEVWAEHPPSSLLARGTPPRYYLQLLPPTLLATALGLRAGGPTPPAVAGLVGTCSALVITAWLVPTTVLPLFRGGLDEGSRRRLVARWHRGNRVRVAALGVAVLGHAAGAVLSAGAGRRSGPGSPASP